MDFLTRLVQRTQGRTSIVQPPMPSRFESPVEMERFKYTPLERQPAPFNRADYEDTSRLAYGPIDQSVDTGPIPTGGAQPGSNRKRPAGPAPGKNRRPQNRDDRWSASAVAEPQPVSRERQTGVAVARVRTNQFGNSVVREVEPSSLAVSHPGEPDRPRPHDRRRIQVSRIGEAGAPTEPNGEKEDAPEPLPSGRATDHDHPPTAHHSSGRIVAADAFEHTPEHVAAAAGSVTTSARQNRQDIHSDYRNVRLEPHGRMTDSMAGRPQFDVVDGMPITPAATFLNVRPRLTSDASPPSIEVNIGRIDIQAVPEAPAAPTVSAHAAVPKPRLSLDEYLQSEIGGGA